MRNFQRFFIGRSDIPCGEIEIIDFVLSVVSESGFAGSFLLVQSTGGLYEAQQAQEQCVRMLESGPAAGVVGAQHRRRRVGSARSLVWPFGHRI